LAEMGYVDARSSELEKTLSTIQFY
jgi:hypothetical protein